MLEPRQVELLQSLVDVLDRAPEAAGPPASAHGGKLEPAPGERRSFRPVLRRFPGFKLFGREH